MPTLIEEQIVFVGESGECGETAAESDGEKEPHVGREGEPARYRPIENADEQTAREVDKECAPGKHGPRRAGDETAGKIAKSTAQTAAEHDEEYVANQFHELQ